MNVQPAKRIDEPLEPCAAPPEGGKPPQGIREWTLAEHLEELRRRLIVSVLALLAGCALGYLLADEAFALLARPLAEALAQEERRMIFTGLPEAFLVKLRLAFFLGFLFAFPVIAAQVYLFLAPGLYRREKKALLPFFVAGPILFFSGAALAYFYIFPLAWSFFVSFETAAPAGAALPVMLEARLEEYLSLAISLIVAFGLAFQLPIVLTLLVRAGVLTPETLARRRKYAVVILLTAAAFLTPPDVMSQIGLFIPLYLLYEVSIVAGKFVHDS